MKKNKIFAGKLASWFMVAMMVGTLVGCGKDVPSTPDTTPNTPVVEADVDTNADVDTDADVDTNVDVDANVDVKTDVDVEPVAEPAKVIYEGLTPGGTGYGTVEANDFVDRGLYTYFVPIDKNEHAAFIGYVGDIIDDGGDYYSVKITIDDPNAISVYTKGIENCQYAVYFEAPSDFTPGISRTHDEAIGGIGVRASSSLFNAIDIAPYPMDAANRDYDWYEHYDTLKDYYIEKGCEDVKEYSFERKDGRLTSIVSYLPKNAKSRIFYGNFISLDESKLINEYYVLLQVLFDFSEEDALAIINSVRFMEKDEADELYMSLLRQTEANEYFDPATIER